MRSWLGLVLAVSMAASAGADPLPSWNSGAAKRQLLEFVAKVTEPGGADYVAPPERIAVFDNDGTLWPSHPIYTQLAFALDRVEAMAPEHPEWQELQPFKAVLEGDKETLANLGEHGLAELVMATHAGMTTAEFEASVRAWFAEARHPRFGRAYDDIAYQPMLELLEYLRASGFKTYIVSGGGVEFMRPVTQKLYGIPPEQVIGSSIKSVYEWRDGQPVLVRLPELFFVDDKGGKPVGIHTFIGRRPIAAFGNSDGDREMLEWTSAGPGARLALLVHHDDGEREYAYGPAGGQPDTPFGRLTAQLLADAKERDWVVVSMRSDWKRIFAAPPPD